MDSSATPTKEATYRRPHILILSDDTGLSTFLSEGLLLGGFWTSIVASGLQALEVFRLRSFDLVLLDATISGLGAIELVRRLRSSNEFGQARVDIPVMIIAAGIDEIDPREAANAGADATLFPPIEIDDLVSTLFRVIGEWRLTRPDRPWADEADQAHPSR